jgi:hypothetical protein
LYIKFSPKNKEFSLPLLLILEAGGRMSRRKYYFSQKAAAGLKPGAMTGCFRGSATPEKVTVFIRRAGFLWYF